MRRIRQADKGGELLVLLTEEFKVKVDGLACFVWSGGKSVPLALELKLG